MNFLKLSAYALLLGTLFLSSCEKDRRNNYFTNTANLGIPMTGAQVVPPNSSMAVGTIDAIYDRKTRLLSYKLTWVGLSGTVTAIHVHSGAGAGYPSLVAPVQAPTGYPTATSGTFSSTLLVDNSVVKEDDLLAGQYYIDIHTTNATYNVTGEIRGQLTFPYQ